MVQTWSYLHQHFSSNIVYPLDKQDIRQCYGCINSTSCVSVPKAMNPEDAPASVTAELAAVPPSVKTQEKMICSTCKEETTDWTRLTTIVI